MSQETPRSTVTLPALREILELAPRVLLLIAFVCTAFAAAASLLLLIAQAINVFDEPSPFALRTGVKAITFGALALASALFLRRTCGKETVSCSGEIPFRNGTAVTLGLLVAGVALFLTTLNLDSYPGLFPDELHHLTVARNLAAHEVYASGLPPDNFKSFDWYDSVGPTVIVPVALALEIGDYSYVAGRIPIVLSMLLLTALVFAFVRRRFGPWHAAGASFLLLLAPGTTFLSRSLYGEVPALLLVVIGILLWDRSAREEGVRSWVLVLLSGILIGAATLTKLFLFVGAFAFVGAWFYDCLTYRRMSLVHLMLPLIGLLLPHFVWLIYKVTHGGTAGTYVFLLSYYRHKLMFGWDTVANGMDGIVGNGWRVISGLIAFAAAAPWVFRRRYSPGLVALYIAVPLFLYWWLCFTPGTISRYSWYSSALAGVFSGILLGMAHETFHGEKIWSRRIWSAALALLVVAPFLHSALHHSKQVVFLDETGDMLGVTEYLEDFPAETTIGTLHYPVQRAMNFFYERPVTEVYDLDEALLAYDYVVGHSIYNELPENGTPEAEFGPYRVYARPTP